MVRWCLVLFHLALATASRAETLTWNFEATIRIADGSGDSAEALLNSIGAVPGAPVHGFVRFESNVADDETLPDIARFQFAILDVEVVFPGGSFARLPNNNGQIFVGSFAGDGSYQWFSDNLVIPPGGNLFYWPAFALELSSHDDGYFDPAGGIPLDPPPLGEIDPFGSDATSIFGYGGDLLVASPSYTVRAELTSLARVPEPSWLAGVGLLVLFLRR